MIQLCVVCIEAGYGLSIYSNISASCCSLHCSHLIWQFTTMLSLNYIELLTLANKIKRNECRLRKAVTGHIDITYLFPFTYVINQKALWKNCQLSHFKTQIIKSLWPIKRLDNARHAGVQCLVFRITNNHCQAVRQSVWIESFSCNGGEKPMPETKAASLWTEGRFQGNLILPRAKGSPLFSKAYS